MKLFYIPMVDDNGEQVHEFVWAEGPVSAAIIFWKPYIEQGLRPIDVWVYSLSDCWPSNSPRRIDAGDMPASKVRGDVDGHFSTIIDLNAVPETPPKAGGRGRI